MDIRLRNRTKILRALAGAVLCLCAAAMLLFYPAFEEAGQEATEDLYEGPANLSDMLSPLLQGNYVLYNEIAKNMDESQLREEMDTSDFRRLEKYMDYCLCDDGGEALLESSAGASEKLDAYGSAGYAIRVSFSFDSEGGLGNVQVGSSYLDRDVQYQIEESLLSGWEALEREWQMQERWPMSLPADVTAVYGMTMDNVKSCLSASMAADAYGGAYLYACWILDSSAFIWVMLFLTVLSGGAGILYRILEREKEEAIFRAPLELVAGAAILLACAMIWPAIMIWKTCTGRLLAASGSSDADRALNFGVNFLVWLLIFSILFWIGGCLWDFLRSPAACLRERSLLVRGVCRLFDSGRGVTDTVRERARGAGRTMKKAVRTQYDALLHLDFRDRTNRLILKIVLLNFIAILLISFLWYYDVWALVIYSIVLFLFLRRYLNRVQRQYRQILKITSTLAEGRLDVPIEGDAGIFAPVQEELVKIQAGFRKAVEREVKSERMKTDLITNVSHDLKTPLTAIITYVDLLKNEEDEEKRREYIGILERKSQRLKVLIEDLFEISKATSKNVTLHFMDLDIIGLLKQVELEYDRDIKAAGLDIRWSLPGEKVVLRLDSQKAYRVFENLIVNITKYALPHTRVFIDVEETDREAVVRMKNVSAAELTFDTEEITDRFVRGDASRNTEGSGLGLAIARSFAELMHGTLQVSTEADLFRVEIRFPKP